MAQDQTKRRLGRGLAALLGDDLPEDASVAEVAEVGEVVTVDSAKPYRLLPIEFLVANPNNPRKDFDDEEIQDLSNSVREKGVLQPIVVRPAREREGHFEIVAGERRWRAAQKASLHEVPVIIRDFSDGEALEIAIVENVQRADLNPLEEADGYSELIERFSYTQEQLSKVIGKSRSHIANTLRLTNLPDTVLEHLRSGDLTAGHARALLSSGVPAEELAKRIIGEGLSVRDAERLAKEVTGKPKSKKAEPAQPVKPDADTLALEKSLSEAIGFKVTISHKGENGGALSIAYKTLEQLDDICRRLSNTG